MTRDARAVIREAIGEDAYRPSQRGVSRDRVLALILVAAILGIFVFFLLVARAKAEELHCSSDLAIQAEALIERGEEFVMAMQFEDGPVYAILRDPVDRSETMILVTEGEDVDQACIRTRTIWAQP